MNARERAAFTAGIETACHELVAGAALIFSEEAARDLAGLPRVPFKAAFEPDA
jgi:hypothetical protein